MPKNKTKDNNDNKTNDTNDSSKKIHHEYNDSDIDSEFDSLDEKIPEPGKLAAPSVGSDGIPVISSENLLVNYIQPAYKRSRTWTAPTPGQKTAISKLIEAFSVRNYADVIKNADALKLSVYRVIQNVENASSGSGPKDSFLLFVTKVRVSTYNGPFLMLRESIESGYAGSSKVIMIIPHNNCDGTNKDSVIGFQNSRALACVMNGHKHSIDNKADFVDHANTLGAVALRKLNEIYPKAVYFHVHGSASKQTCLYRARSAVMGASFKKSMETYTNITRFDNFNAGYIVDEICSSPFYLKTEIPVRVHMNNTNILAKIIIDFEKNAWANFGNDTFSES